MHQKWQDNIKIKLIIILNIIMKAQYTNLGLKTEKNIPLTFKQEKITTPLVFEKKKSKSVIKTLKYINSDTGKTRYYPAASQEWYNSIYTFNKNYAKSLPALDKTLATLLQNYCNMWPRDRKQKIDETIFQKLMNSTWKNFRGRDKYSLRKKNTIKAIKLYNKKKRLSPKKVFVGKGDLKHTSDKVIVTLFTYNIQKRHLLRKMWALIYSFFLTKKVLLRFETWAGKDRKKDTGIKFVSVKMQGKKKDRVKRNLITNTYPSKFITVAVKEAVEYKKVFLSRRRLTLDEYLNSSFSYCKRFVNDPYKYLNKKSFLKKLLPRHFAKKVEKLGKIKDPLFTNSSYFNLLSYALLRVKDVTAKLEIINHYYKYLTKLVEKKILNENEKLLIFISKANKFNVYKYKVSRFINTKFKEKKIYLASLIRIAWFLYVNDVKFKHPMLVSKLKYLVQNLYDKEVEFNIVELKKLHLSSDIYTQLVALKLKNRNNKLYWVLRRSLRKVDLPNVCRDEERYSEFNRDEYLANKIRNRYINSMFDNKLNKVDSLNNLLLDLFPSVYGVSQKIKSRYSSTKLKPVSIEKYVLNNLKNNKLAGIRVEAKGRLTRRFTAQRSVFKMQYKGGLKNVDSSFKGLSAVMLRGFLKNNVEYSVVQSKNLNGAYGVKGWVGYKEEA